jgi:endonuclease-3
MVAVVLSAQSTDEQVNRVTAELFADYGTPEALAAIDLSLLEEKIRGVGLYRNKARHLKKLAQIIVEQHQGEVPSEFDKLLSLPGVGRKSANVIRSVAFKKPGLGVDTHVHRVANRLGLVNSKLPEQTEKALKEQIPEECWSEAHHLLIFHGRRICQARKPQCNNCLIEGLCEKRFGK